MKELDSKETRLYFLRHGIAVDRGAPGVRDDSRRPLTAEGRKKMRASARGMKAIGLTFDLILSSPYPRALETAEIVKRTFGKKLPLRRCAELRPGGSGTRLFLVLRKLLRKRKDVLLVGHEPSLSRLISKLLSEGEPPFLQLKKGGLCKLSADRIVFGRCATLHWLLTPSQLERMTS